MKKSGLFIFNLLVILIAGFVSCTKSDNSIGSATDRTKFLGTWSVHEIHSKADFTVIITADPNESTRILLDNFANLLSGNKATAYVSGNSITLDVNQVVGSMTVIGGGGTLSGSTIINWSYSLTDGATRIDATAVYTKN